MRVLVFLNDSDPGDPLVFESAAAFFRYCERERFLQNGDPKEWELMRERLALGKDWADHAGALVWREIER